MWLPLHLPLQVSHTLRTRGRGDEVFLRTDRIKPIGGGQGALAGGHLGRGDWGPGERGGDHGQVRLIDQHNAKMPGTLQRELKRRTPTDSAMSGRSRVGAGTMRFASSST